MFNDDTGRIIGLAIKVHRRLGPGLLEPAYRANIIADQQTILEIKSVERIL